MMTVPSMTKIRSYSELSNIDSFEDRFEYLKLGGGVGRSTFGFDRHVNQQFYSSREWQDIRQYVIFRDEGCDLGVLGYEIHVSPLIHHMNPINVNDIIQHDMSILDPEFLITTTHKTHNDIHFGVKRSIPNVVTQRTPNDTKLW
jgi:hypothetical protein